MSINDISYQGCFPGGLFLFPLFFHLSLPPPLLIYAPTRFCSVFSVFSHLYTRVCLSVRPSVHRSVRPSRVIFEGEKYAC